MDILGTLQAHPLLTLSAILTTYLLISFTHSYHRLSHVPGPRLASWSYLWLFTTSVSGRAGRSFRDLNQQHNSRLVRVSPNDLITDDLSVIRRINGARSTYTRSWWYGLLRMDPHRAGLFSLMDTAAHDRLKAKMSFGYGGRDNPWLEEGIDEQLGELVRLIRRKYVSDACGGRLRKMDLARVVQFFTLDVITRLAFGDAFGYLCGDEDVFGYAKTVRAMGPVMVGLSSVPWLGRVFMSPTVLGLLGPKKTDETGIGRILRAAEEVVAKRFTTKAQLPDNDMLSSFIRHGVTQSECEIEVPFQLAAGSDTTATAIHGTLLHLLSSPRAYTRLQREIDAAIASGSISSPIRASEGRKLEYLQAVIYEGLRCRPPNSGLFAKTVPPGGDVICGVWVPGGTNIGVNHLGTQRYAKIFGEDAEVFRPERWIGSGEEKCAEMMATVEMAFGLGRWGCAGKPVAFLELNKVFVELLRNFDFEMVDPTKPWHEMNYNMFMHTDMWVRVTERSQLAG